MTATVRTTLLVFLAALGAWEIAAQATRGRGLPMLGLLLGLVLLGAVARPQVTAIMLLALGGTVFSDRLGAMQAGGVRTDLVELLGFLLIGACAVRLLLGAAQLPRLLGPWLAFQAAVVLGLLLGVAHGTPQDILVGSAKDYLRYLLPVAFAVVFASYQDKDRLERWVLRLCDVGTLMTVLAATVHVSLSSAFVDQQIYTGGVAMDAERIRTPLLSLVVLGLLLVLARALDEGLTPAAAARIIAYPLPVLLSFNRSTWLPLIIALLLLGVLRRGERRRGRGLAVTLVVAGTGSVLVLASFSGALGPTAHALVARATSVLQPSVTQDLSFTDRKEESADALRALAGSPLTGVGIGQPYGARRALYVEDPPRLVYYDRLFTHNTYLGIWLQTGLLGLAAVGWLGLAVLREAKAALAQLPPRASSRHLAAALCLGVYAMSALLQTSLGDRATILGISCAFALVVRPRVVPVPSPGAPA